MAAAVYNIVAGQGETFNLSFTVDNDGVPWNLNSYTAAMQVRPFAGSTSLVLNLSTANASITLNSSGQVAVTATATVMAAIAAEKYVYDLEITAPNATVTRLLSGKFIVTPEVTV
jgi:hypothetical protein